MAGYTKLFSLILASTVWREDDKTRIVWITLLALANKYGIAETSIPGLADFARVSIADCETALEKLKAPDRYSRTKESEGRRIEETEGGFAIINHAKYRDMLSAEERREYNRIKQQEHRAKASSNVNESQKGFDKSALSAHTKEEAKAKEELPEPLRSSSELINLWIEWKRHRSQKGKFTEVTKKRQIKKLASLGTQKAISALTNSLDQGYTGIFEPNGAGNRRHNATNRNEGTLNAGRASAYRGVGKV